MVKISKIEFITYNEAEWMTKIAARLDLKKDKFNRYYGKLISDDSYSPSIYIKPEWMHYNIQIEGDIYLWYKEKKKDYPMDFSFKDFEKKLREFLKIEKEVIDDARVTEFAREENIFLRKVWIK